MSDDLIERIKDDEGFRGNVYKDSLGYDTVGYGTKMPITKLEATMLLRGRLYQKKEELERKEPYFKYLPEPIADVVLEMAYQLGVNGVLKFKRMWKALKDGDYDKAANEMLDSRWAVQTPNRAKRLSNIVRNFENV